MKTLIIFLLMTVTAGAAELTTLGFRAFSTATQKQCTVFASHDKQQSDAFVTRQYNLDTKGFGNFSTNAGSGSRWNSIKFTCVASGTVTPQIVKLYFNKIETHFLTTSSDNILSGR